MRAARARLAAAGGQRRGHRPAPHAAGEGRRPRRDSRRRRDVARVPVGEARHPARVPAGARGRHVAADRRPRAPGVQLLRQAHRASAQHAVGVRRARGAGRDDHPPGRVHGARRGRHAAGVHQRRRVRRRGDDGRQPRAGRLVRADRRASARQRRGADRRRARARERAAGDRRGRGLRRRQLRRVRGHGRAAPRRARRRRDPHARHAGLRSREGDGVPRHARPTARDPRGRRRRAGLAPREGRVGGGRGPLGADAGHREVPGREDRPGDGVGAVAAVWGASASLLAPRASRALPRRRRVRGARSEERGGIS